MSVLRTTFNIRRRKITAALCCVPLLIVLAGCPYESHNPLGSPAGAKIDEKLLGGWAYGEEGEKEAGLVTISRFNDSELLIVLEEKGKKERQMMRGFVTQIDGVKFMNLQEMQGGYETRKWIFVRYETGDCSLTYRPVNDSVVPGGASEALSPEQLYELIRKNLGKAQIYDGETTLTCARK